MGCLLKNPCELDEDNDPTRFELCLLTAYVVTQFSHDQHPPHSIKPSFLLISTFSYVASCHFGPVLVLSLARSDGENLRPAKMQCIDLYHIRISSQCCWYLSSPPWHPSPLAVKPWAIGPSMEAGTKSRIIG